MTSSCSGCWNISHYKQSFSELLSHGWLRYVTLGWIKPFPIWSKLMLLFYIGPCFVAFQVETLVRDMDNIYIKSIQAVQKVMINDKHCFELYPFTWFTYNVLLQCVASFDIQQVVERVSHDFLVYFSWQKHKDMVMIFWLTPNLNRESFFLRLTLCLYFWNFFIP